MRRFARLPLLILFFATIHFFTYAQKQVLLKCINAVKSVKSISYVTTAKSNDFFSDKTFAVSSKLSFAVRDGKLSNPLYNILIDTKESDGYNYSEHNIFNGNDLLNIDLTNKTYRIKKEYHQHIDEESNVYDLANTLTGYLENKGLVIKQLKDSVISHQLCYHITVKTADSIIKKNDSYSYRNLFISKKNNFPVCIKTSQKGQLEKGGMLIGTFKMWSETTFGGYKLNMVTPGYFALKIPDGVTEEKPKLPLLTTGSSAPGWALKSTYGQTLTMASLKGKVVLLDITASSCPACMLSIPPLNKLYAKYKGTDVAIVSIYLDDAKNALVKFIKRNNVEYPVFFNGNSIKPSYHVSSIPVFYIVDKQGIINKVYDGFFDDFEHEITTQIDSIRQNHN